MDDLVRDLSSQARVLDLGAGGGSFDYSSTAARVVAVDLAFPPSGQACAGRLVADSGALPLRSGSFDVVVCNHTLEHFENLSEAVGEIDRVLRPGGFLWAAVPDGFSFTDRLYRWVFEGGGHVNQFTLSSFIQALQNGACLRVRSCKILYSSFIYLNPPRPEALIHYNDRAQQLSRVPPRLLEALLRALNYAVRRLDGWFKRGWSLYGWGVVFEKVTSKGDAPSASAAQQIEWIPGCINVCFSCGAGHPAAALATRLERFLLLWKVYRCPCGKRNFYFEDREAALPNGADFKDSRRSAGLS